MRLGRGNDDHAGHLRCGEVTDVPEFGLAVVAGFAQHDLALVAVHGLRESVRDGGVETVADVGDDEPDDRAARAAHHAGRPVGDVAELLSYLVDPELRLRADPVVIGQGSSDRGDGQVQAAPRYLS